MTGIEDSRAWSSPEQTEKYYHLRSIEAIEEHAVSRAGNDPNSAGHFSRWQRDVCS
jgi:hypothetical protein